MQPIDLWPKPQRQLWEDRADARRRVQLNDSPDQPFLIVSGGPVGPHAVVLPSRGETPIESQVVRHV